MNRLQFFLILIVFPMLVKAQSYFKLDSIQSINFKRADVVFLGEVTEIDTINLTCKMRTFETFKGNPPETLKFIITSAYTYIPEPAGLWIIYANKVNDTIFIVSDRSISRSNLYPNRINYYVPKPPRRKVSKLESQNLLINLKINALTDWNNELYKLRNNLIK